MKYDIQGLKTDLKLYADCQYPLPYGGLRSDNVDYWTGVQCGKAMLARAILGWFFGEEPLDK